MRYILSLLAALVLFACISLVAMKSTNGFCTSCASHSCTFSVECGSWCYCVSNGIDPGYCAAAQVAP